MDTLNQFMAYAQDFEKTYVDDNWDRLTQYFHGDAIYQVESTLMGCKLVGPEAIFAGIRKSLNGLDRRFDTREIGLVDDIEVEGETLKASWFATYTVGDLPAYVLHGKSTVTMRDGKIEKLVDSYDDQSAQAFTDWVEKTGFELDPSYV